jgi:hypothetical protein
VVDSQPEEDGAVRAITFANGMKARERKVTVDPAAKRVNLFLHTVRVITPDVEGTDRARSATKAFLFRRLETLGQTRGASA